MRLKFEYADGLRLRGDRGLTGFALRGESGDWVWAQGKIENDEIILLERSGPQTRRRPLRLGL